MATKRVNGRFAKEVPDSDVGAERESKEPAVKAPRPRYCRTFTRARLAEALPDIVETFTEEAKKGSIAHAKVLIKIGGLDTGDVAPKATKRRGKNPIAVMVQRLLDMKKAEAEAADSAGESETAERPNTDLHG